MCPQGSPLQEAVDESVSSTAIGKFDGISSMLEWMASQIEF